MLNQPDRQDSRQLASLATLLTGVIAVGILYLAREILIPIALAVLISFILAPLALALRRIGVARVPANILVVILGFGLILGIGALGGVQLSKLAEQLPQYQTNISDKIRAIKGTSTNTGAVARATSVLEGIGREISQGTPTQPTAEGKVTPPIPVEIRPSAANPFKVAIDFVHPLLSPLASTGLVILFVIFILLQREDLRDRVIKLLGTKDLHRTTEVMDEAASSLSRYFLLQTVLNAGFGVVVGVALWIIGVPSPLLWGIFSMVMRFVPYIGSFLAAVLPVVLAAAVDPGWTMVGWTIALFVIGEPLMGHVIEPLVFGKHTGLSPIAIVTSATFWTWLWGPIGLVLATPLTLCLVILGQFTQQFKFLHVLLGDQPALTPAEGFYQRLLAGDPTEIIDQAAHLLKDRPLVAYYEEVALKGLALAQQDMGRGELQPERQALLVEGISDVVEALTELEEIEEIAHTKKMSKNADASPDANVQPPPAVPSKPRQVSVVCVGGRGPVDHSAATLLVHLLERNGIGAQIARLQGAAEPVGWANGAIVMVCICYVATARSAQVRLMIKRVQRLFPQAEIMIGLWAMRSDAAEIREIKEGAAGSSYSANLTEALDICSARVAATSDAHEIGEGVNQMSNPSLIGATT